MTKNNFYIITGGPGGGKTCLLNALTSRGISYIPETAREIIKQRLSQGLSPRPDPAEFAGCMFSKDFENYISNLHLTSKVFFDRSFLDSAFLLHQADIKAYGEIESILTNNRYNKKVFATPPWKEIYRTDSERDQTFDEAIKVYDNICRWYSDQNYEIILVPKESIEIRCTFILGQI